MNMFEQLVENKVAFVSLGVLIGLLSWESIRPFFGFFRKRLRKRAVHAGRNLTLWLINKAMISLVFVASWAWAAEFTKVNQFGLLYHADLTQGSRAALAILLFDVWTYWWHRLSHVLPFLWRFHRTHHSDPHMDVTTANRFHTGEILISSVLRIPLILLLGAELWHLALYEALMFPVVQTQHANIGLGHKLDRFMSLFIVTPNMHKVHHSRVQAETNSNYTSLFSIWDRLFGSFRLRDDPEKIELGLEGYDSSERQTLLGLLKTPLGK